MIALQITSTKTFMNRFLAGDTFDVFLLEEALIQTAVTYTIDGHINTDFFPPEERTSDNLPYEFQPWSETKGLCFHLIKGKNTPLFFKFVLHLKPEKANALLTGKNPLMDISQIKSLVLNIRFDGTKTILTTGTSYHSFRLDKEPDAIWDNAITQFLAKNDIPFEKL